MRVYSLPYEDVCIYKLKIDKVNKGIANLRVSQRELVKMANDELSGTGFKFAESQISELLTGKRTITPKMAAFIDFALKVLKEREEYWEEVRRKIDMNRY
ncbi:MAG: hypothetical protein MJZ20_05685 [Bacteroidaceae bacterium]|nr:hypothetical protein [Bacteroidaceae bacterium]